MIINETPPQDVLPFRVDSVLICDLDIAIIKDTNTPAVIGEIQQPGSNRERERDLMMILFLVIICLVKL